jgi:hypothetical protein
VAEFGLYSLLDAHIVHFFDKLVPVVDKGSVGRSSSGVEIRGKGCHAEKS